MTRTPPGDVKAGPDKAPRPDDAAGDILIIGLGLIGGSLAAAVKQAQPDTVILGCDPSAESIRRGIEMGIIDDGCLNIDALARLPALIVIAVPMLAIPPVLEALTAHDSDLSDRVITDVASSKGAVRACARDVFGQVPAGFVLGHPIAGSEKSGVSAATPDLYRDHKVILTPESNTDRQALIRVRRLWTLCGADVVEMDVDRHDEVLARTSHLPHLLAFSLVDTLARQDQRLDIFRYAAGGFRDFTRIAGSDPVMWRDIYLANPKAVLEALDDFEQGLATLRHAVSQGDGDALLATFDRASHARRHFETLLNNTSYQAEYHMQAQGKVSYQAQPGGQVRGTIRVPGDKSISHRSIMLGALADGMTEVKGFLEGEDSLATLQAFREMGVAIEGPYQGRVLIHGVGMTGLKAPSGPIYVGNSGTAMRLFAGLLAGQSFASELTGDDSLTRRPMGRVADPLRLMGAVIDTAEGGRPPLRIHPNQSLTGIDYLMPMASAQVKSCLLLAGMRASGVTRVTEPAPTRDHTERMLNGFGYPVAREGASCWLTGGGALKGGTIDVPSDISSATFFIVAAAIAPGSELVLSHVGINPTRVGVLNILELMGADIALSGQREVGGEPVADIRVRHAPLKGIDIPVDQVPLAIDEFPAIFIAAANADGVTRLRGAEELRVKESDRIQAMANGLSVLGVEHCVVDDGIDIVGNGDSTCSSYQGGHIDSLGDHRIAMAFSIAALRAASPIVIDDCANVATSFPGFISLAREVGITLDETLQNSERKTGGELDA